MKTGQQVITDIIELLHGTSLAGGVNGDIYRPGTRPRSSKAEDIVVNFTTGDAEQFQGGVATINIFVPHIPTNQNGVLVPNSGRCEEVEDLAKEFVKSLTARVSNYKFKLRNAIHTNESDEINQSFVVIRLGFTFID